MDKIRVACVPESALLLARLRDAVAPHGLVQQFADADSVLPAIAAGHIDCTVVSLDGETIDRDLGAIRRLREAFPRHPIVVWCEMRSLLSRQLLDVAQLDIAELAFRGITDSRHAFAQLLSSARQRASARELHQRLSELLPKSMQPLFVMALERAAEPLDVARAAAAFGVTRQTLRNRLLHHGLPRPQPFLIWCRLLVAGTLLDERGRTLDSVALQLGFSSGQNLGAALRRYVGATLTELREGQVGVAVEGEFARIVGRGRARAAAAREAQRAHSLPAPSTAD